MPAIECDGCDQDPWTATVHYGSCPLVDRADYFDSINGSR